MNVAAAEVVIDSSAASCCGTPFAATSGSAFSAASISTRRSSCDVLPHEFLKTRHMQRFLAEAIAADWGGPLRGRFRLRARAVVTSICS